MATGIYLTKSGRIGKRGKSGIYPRSEATRKKMSESRKGKHPTEATLAKRRISLGGENSPRWKGGISKRPGYGSFKTRMRRIRKKGNGGSHTMGEWDNLKAQYNFTCPPCGRTEPEITLTEDHIIPICRGGSNNIENIQPLCKSCNSKKSSKVVKYEPYLQKTPAVPERYLIP